MKRPKSKPSSRIKDIALLAAICTIVTAFNNASPSMVLIILVLFGLTKRSEACALVVFLLRNSKAIPVALALTTSKAATNLRMGAERLSYTASHKIRALFLKNPHSPDGFSAIHIRIYAWCVAAVGFIVTLCFFPGGYKEIRIPLMLMCIAICSVVFASVCKKEKRLGAILMNALLMLGFFNSFMSANVLSLAGSGDIIALGSSGCLLFVWVHKVPIANYLPRR